MSKIKDITIPKGPVLIFGGVYSNLQSLQALQTIANNLNIPSSNIICTGDIVGYCAQPEEVVQSVKNWGIHCITGNVEIQLREGQEDCGCNFDENSRCDVFSRQWYPYAQNQLSSSSIEWMQSLPEFLHFKYAGKKCLVVHGSYHDTSEFIFRSTPWDIKQTNFIASQSEIIFAGHCGLPFNDTKNDYHWINPGVIGMPANDGNTQVWYATLNDSQGFTFQHHTYKYNNQLAAQLMRENKLPASYAKTLETGLWDNCEILPEVETREMGQAILL